MHPKGRLTASSLEPETILMKLLAVIVALLAPTVALELKQDTEPVEVLVV